MLFLLLLSCGSQAPTDSVGHAFRLTHRQWENSVTDLLELPEPTGLSDSFVPDPILATFDTDPTDLVVSPVLWQQYQSAAEQLAERVVKDADLYKGLVPDEDRDAWIEAFGARAFRRPLEGKEEAQLAELFDAGEAAFDSGNGFKDGVRAAVTGMLQSPGFLYRTEGLYGTAEEGELSADELASKLSYALWNTMPDATLLAAAEEDGLTPATLAAQVERMLDDPRGHAMLADLHRQLLHVDAYAQIWRPSDQVLGIGTYAESTPAAMQAEVYAFVDDLVYSGGTLSDLLTSPRTFANADLADIYEVEGVEGTDLVPIELDPTQRAGMLTMSGFLAWQADTSRPNLIERGAFVNDAWLCVDLPPPPASATPLPTEEVWASLREEIEDHTSSCGGGCHNDLINPIGFAFGAYDEDGYYRPGEAGGLFPLKGTEVEIDTSGSYAFEEGTFDFDDAVELAGIMADSAQVHRCYAGHLASYLEGRSSDEVDPVLLDSLASDSLAGRSIRGLVVEILTDPSFRALRP